MHPLLTHLRGLVAYLSAWVLAGGLLALAWQPEAPAAWTWRLGFLLPLAVFTGMAALALYPVCRSFPFRPARWPGLLARRAVAVGVLALVSGAAAALWNSTGLRWGRDGLVTLPPPAWLALLGVLVVVFAVSALVHDALLAQQALQAAAANEVQARLMAREMELKALRKQLDPHFLFNSLNSISALIPLDPAAARAMTVDLAGFLRQTLSLGERERIRLDEELDLVQHYLAIEQRRLGDKLQVAVEADAACRRAWLPPLVLQPLVENAIKHGIRPLERGGRVDLSARRAGERLVLPVSNPVDAQAPRDATGLGQGLRHLRTRLQTQYDEPAVVDVERTADRHTVRVSLPWHP
ncbi:MAG TPA: histidine kinase [Burkholderiaceae bacterium]|nr:histidine kinase [Burkholderiaceae bacterium]